MASSWAAACLALALLLTACSDDSSPVSVQTGQDLELQSHPLGDLVLSPVQVEEIFGGQWQTTWANPVEQDLISVPDASECNATTTQQTVATEGIDLSYTNTQGSGFELNLRQGAAVEVLLESADFLISCMLGPDVFAQRTIRIPNDQTSIVRTLRDDESGTSFYTSFVLVRSGDLLVSASVDADTQTAAEANEQLLIDAVATVLEQS